jgi:hypothetical protein
MSDHSNDPFDELMRRALAEEADRIEPADALPEIRARAHAQRRPATRRPWVVTAGAAALGTAAAIGAFTVLDDNGKSATDDQIAGPGTTTSASGVPLSATPGPTTATPLPPTVVPSASGKPEPAVKGALVPVYWLGDRVGVTREPTVRLYRTWAKVQGRPAVEAVRIMTSKQPPDPDYYSVWRGAEINSVTRDNGVVTVDFNQLPKTRLDPAVADVAAQQLIYTVQGALGDSSEQVQITQQGRPGGMLFGQVDTSRPLSRAQAANVQALVWINSPMDGQVTKSPVTVEGIASAYEATVNWRAINLKTRATQQGFTNAKEGQKFSPFAVTLKLTPGEWRIEAYLISAEDGRITDTDSKTVIAK